MATVLDRQSSRSGILSVCFETLTNLSIPSRIATSWTKLITFQGILCSIQEGRTENKETGETEKRNDKVSIFEVCQNDGTSGICGCI